MSTRLVVAKLRQQEDSGHSIHADLKDNNDVIIVRSCDFGKTLYFSFRKDYDDRTLNDNKHQLSLN